LWTAGIDYKSDPGKYTWCSTKYAEADYVKDSLYFSGTKRNNSCIHIEIPDARAQKKFEPKLGYDDCKNKKRFVCEVTVTFVTKRM
jgi:hypothetical protein